MLTKKRAEALPWCLVADGRVHVASWLYGGLVTYVEDEGGNVICCHDRPVSLDFLDVFGIVWRDRRQIGVPTCLACENSVLEEDRFRAEGLID